MSNKDQTATAIKLAPDNAKGILWALVAALLYATAAAMAKVAVNEFHVLQILFFRQIVVFLSSLPSIAKSFPDSLKTEHSGIHVLRLVGAFVALFCGIWAVAVLPLTTAITLSFAQAFFVALLALWFLNESFGRRRVIAIIVGFLGVVIIMRPGVEGLAHLSALIPVVGAMGAALAVISVRKLSQTESTATLLVYQSTFVGLLAGVPLIWFWVTPDFSDLLFLFAMGIVAAAGQWVGVKSLRLGEASVIGSVQYIQLVFAAAIGFSLFGEIPDTHTVMGALVIVGSSLYMLHREALRNAHK